MEAHIDRSIALYPRNYRNFQFIAPRFTERLFALIAALFVRFFIAGLKSRQCDIAVELQKLWKSGPGGPRYPFWGSFSLPIAGYKYARDTVSRRPSDDIPSGTCESRQCVPSFPFPRYRSAAAMVEFTRSSKIRLRLATFHPRQVKLNDGSTD